MKHAKLIGVILVALVVIILVVQNIEVMSRTMQFRINVVFFRELRSPPMAFGLVTVITFLFGVFIVGMCGMVERFRLKRQIKNCKRELEIKVQELNSLRNLPITSEDMGAGPLNGGQD